MDRSAQPPPQIRDSGICAGFGYNSAAMSHSPPTPPFGPNSPPHSGRRRFLRALALLGAGGIIGSGGLGGWTPAARAAERLADILAEHAPGDLRQYLVSEKLDGVRARWNGHQLLSRGGGIFAAPAWFTADFPHQHLDGELWIRRGAFEQVSGIVRRKIPGEEWRQIRFVVFDLPRSPDPFAVRAEKIPALAGGRSPFLDHAPQFPVESESDLAARFAAIVENGGEGLMLRKKNSAHNRPSDFIKIKPHDDADATVIAHNPGKGKHAGRLGSLTVEDSEGRRFRVGTGFTDAQRENPPPPGAVITFRHNGRTVNGLPRFPVFLRARADEPLP